METYRDHAGSVMRRIGISHFVGLLAISWLSGIGSSEGATTFLDLTGGGQGTVNGAIFRTTNFQPSGTGVIDPFVRLQSQGNNKYEAGYNTSLGTPLDVLSNGKA